MDDTKLRIHSHPKMEKSRRLPKGHVIIDEGLFWELVRRFGSRLRVTP